MTSEDTLKCMFTAEVTNEDGSYTVELPADEVELGNIDPDAPVQVAVYQDESLATPTQEKQSRSDSERQSHKDRLPPVSKGEQRTVTIDHLGDQGDGIAKVDGGFVLIVPDTDVGETCEVEVVRVNDNFAIAEPVTTNSDTDNNSQSGSGRQVGETA